jgi:type II secretory pathway component GspD/PulD (secretin)
MSLAGLTGMTCLPQNTGNAPEKRPASGAPAESGPKSFYQLNFVVRELENERVVNSRSYSIILSNDNERSSIRAGEKVPFSSISGERSEWQQIDVGVNIDCAKLQDLGGRVALKISAEISSLMENHGDSSPPASLPIIRNNRWESNVMLPLKEATILYSSDDPASKRKMQLQLTVTTIR